MSNIIKNATNSNFTEEVLNYNGLVLVDFTAPWCGPCRSMEPHLNALAKSHADKVKIIKINVDDEPELAAKHQIRSIPAMMLYEDGMRLESKTGAMSEGALRLWIEGHI